MRKKMAGPLKGFHVAIIHTRLPKTCPQFLWINLCEKAFPHDKSLIFIKEISPMKILAASQAAFAAPALPASSHFLWTKLCASAQSSTKPLDS
jgi:hypothetical protein